MLEDAFDASTTQLTLILGLGEMAGLGTLLVGWTLDRGRVRHQRPGHPLGVWRGPRDATDQLQVPIGPLSGCSKFARTGTRAENPAQVGSAHHEVE